MAGSSSLIGYIRGARLRGPVDLGPGGSLNAPGGVFGPNAGLPSIGGSVFYVDPVAGSNLNDGSSPTQALATTQAAVTLCVENRGDFIIRMPGIEHAGDVPLLLNKRGITLIGVSGINNWRPENCAYWRCTEVAGIPVAASATGPGVIVSQACRIFGMEFFAANTIVGVGALLAGALAFDGGVTGGYVGGFSHISNCVFPGWGMCGVGINLIYAGYNRIEACEFDENTEAGVQLTINPTGNPNHNEIVDCDFYGTVQGIDTSPGTTPLDTKVKYCRFSRSAGQAMVNGIRVTGAPTTWNGGLIMGNHFGMPQATAIDLAQAALAALNIQVAGNTYNDARAGAAAVVEGVDPRA